MQKKGFEVNLIDSPAEGYDLSKTLDLIRTFNPRMVVIDTSTPSIDSDAKVAEAIKKVHARSFSGDGGNTRLCHY